MQSHPSSSPAAFDSAAPFYDAEFETSPATPRLREIVVSEALRFFTPGSRLLELNCGTGTDAITLAERGFRVVATDASVPMLREAERKIEARGLGNRIRLLPLDFDALPTLGGETFDGVFSNFGGLNCVRDLLPVSEALSSLVRPGGFVVACFLSDFCLWETAAFLSRADPRGAFRRRRSGGNVATIHGHPVPLFFRSPGEISRRFSPFFRTVSVSGLNIFSPPPSSRNAYRILGGAVRLLEGIDDLIARLFPLNRMGDHFVQVLERRLG